MITKQQFIDQYLERSGYTDKGKAEWLKSHVALPCDCRLSGGSKAPFFYLNLPQLVAASNTFQHFLGWFQQKKRVQSPFFGEKVRFRVRVQKRCFSLPTPSNRLFTPSFEGKTSLLL